MMIVMVIGLLLFISCLAAAGLIASTQNGADAARAIASLDIDPDVSV
jgi:hypothetical protein